MSLPITARVKRTGTKKACGCPSNCNCGKTPAKKALKGDQDKLPMELQNAIKAAPGKMYGSPVKMSCYGKKK